MRLLCRSYSGRQRRFIRSDCCSSPRSGWDHRRCADDLDGPGHRHGAPADPGARRAGPRRGRDVRVRVRDGRRERRVPGARGDLRRRRGLAHRRPRAGASARHPKGVRGTGSWVPAAEGPSARLVGGWAAPGAWQPRTCAPASSHRRPTCSWSWPAPTTCWDRSRWATSRDNLLAIVDTADIDDVLVLAVPLLTPAARGRPDTTTGSPTWPPSRAGSTSTRGPLSPVPTAGCPARAPTGCTRRRPWPTRSARWSGRR